MDEPAASEIANSTETPSDFCICVCAQIWFYTNEKAQKEFNGVLFFRHSYFFEDKKAALGMGEGVL